MDASGRRRRIEVVKRNRDRRSSDASEDGGSPPVPLTAPSGRGGGARVVIRKNDRIELVETDRIDWIEAVGDYVRIHADGTTHLLRSTMPAVARRREGEGFVRIHRSYVVRPDRIRSLHPRRHGDYDLVLRDGATLPLSRNYRDRLASVLGVEL